MALLSFMLFHSIYLSYVRNLSSPAEKNASKCIGSTRWYMLSYYYHPFSSFIVLTPRVLSSSPPSVFLFICPTAAPLPPLPHLSCKTTVSSLTRLFLFLCLSLSTCWPHYFTYFSSFSLRLGSLDPTHFQSHSTFPWQNQEWESNDQLLPLHLLSEPELWKKALSLQTLHRLWRYVLCCPYRKGLWCDWNFWGPWENVRELEPKVSSWHLLPEATS